MKNLQNQVAEIKTNLQKYPEVRNKRLSIIDKAILTLKDLFVRAKTFDPLTLMRERKAIRSEIEAKGAEKIGKVIGEKYSPLLYQEKVALTDRVVGDIEHEHRSYDKNMHIKAIER